MKRVELLTKLQEIAPTYSFGEHPANAKKPYLVLIQNSWTKSPTNSFAGWSNWRVIVVNPTSLRGLDNLETKVMDLLYTMDVEIQPHGKLSDFYDKSFNGFTNEVAFRIPEVNKYLK